MSSLPPPDIETDELLLVTGGTLYSVTGPVGLLRALPSWVTVVPFDAPPGAFPVVKHFLVTHEVQVGTVAELVEHFRTQLTRAYHQLACSLPPGEEQPIIPMMGEASLRRQNAALAEMTSGQVGASVRLPVSPEQHEAFMAPRYETFGQRKPRQSADERDVLKRLVATFFNVIQNENPDGTYKALLAPTDDPVRVRALIAALTTLAEDAEAGHEPAAVPVQ